MENLRENLVKTLIDLMHKKQEIRDQIDRLENSENYPKIKDIFEGRFFKIKDIESRTEEWCIYSFCKEVLTSQDGLFDTFRTDSEGTHFSINRRCRISNFCDEEITKEEYKTALLSVIRQASLLAKLSKE